MAALVLIHLNHFLHLHSYFLRLHSYFLHLHELIYLHAELFAAPSTYLYTFRQAQLADIRAIQQELRGKEIALLT